VTLAVEIQWRRGNTVPYPPNRRRGRTNAGFVDLRDDPQRVKDIHEAQQSRALATLLRRLAVSDRWMSLGCDIGSHDEIRGTETRYCSGGYVQITYRDLNVGSDVYEALAGQIAAQVGREARRCDWWLGLDVSEIRYRLDQAADEPYSLWIWFLASAPTPGRAATRRERLIRTVTTALLGPLHR
jgi:hypothetical protein